MCVYMLFWWHDDVTWTIFCPNDPSMRSLKGATWQAEMLTPPSHTWDPRPSPTCEQRSWPALRIPSVSNCCGCEPRIPMVPSGALSLSFIQIWTTTKELQIQSIGKLISWCHLRKTHLCDYPGFCAEQDLVGRPIQKFHWAPNEVVQSPANRYQIKSLSTCHRILSHGAKPFWIHCGSRWEMKHESSLRNRKLLRV